MNILFVGAHHDDLEVGIGGSVRKWADQGHKIVSVILTNSKWISPDGHYYRNDEDIDGEHIKSSVQLGYEPISLNICNAMQLKFHDEIVVEIIRILEKYNIDMLVFPWIYDVHPDHRVAGEIALAASRRIPKILMTKISWNSVPQTFNPNYFVNISDYIDIKLEAIKNYSEEYIRVGDLWGKFILSSGTIYGLESNCEYAEGFEIVRFTD
jgi:N-acetylglucosamine malate deacetylase 1